MSEDDINVSTQKTVDLPMSYKHIFLLWILSILSLTSVRGQGALDNPYQVIYNHLVNLQDEQYEPAQSARSFPASLDSLERIRMAKRMKQIYDGRGLYVHVERLPKDSLYKDSTAQDYIFFPYPEELPSVYLERINDHWQYSVETSKVIPRLFRETYPFGLYNLVDIVPGHGGTKFLGLYGWQYLGILFIALLSILLYFLLSSLLDFILARTIWRSSLLDETKKKMLQKCDGYLTLSMLTYIIIHLIPILRLPIKFSAIVQDIGRVFFTIFMMLLALRLVDVLKSYLKDLTEKTISRLDEQLLPILIKFLKIIIVIIAIFRVLHIMDVNVTALIAGISIGGLALALAAQDTVKNLIGSMMIFFDKPFQIGDYIISGDIEGSVVEVGFRTTRVKKVDTAVISVPNGKIADSNLTNLGVRNLRMFQTTFGLMYNTPVDKIEEFIKRLRELVRDYPLIAPEPQYIFLQNLNASSIDILFRVYVDTNDYPQELAMKEELIFKILRLAEEVGVGFAFPSSSIYIEQMPNKIQ